MREDMVCSQLKMSKSDLHAKSPWHRLTQCAARPAPDCCHTSSRQGPVSASPVLTKHSWLRDLEACYSQRAEDGRLRCSYRFHSLKSMRQVSPRTQTFHISLPASHTSPSQTFSPKPMLLYSYREHSTAGPIIISHLLSHPAGYCRDRSPRTSSV
jgi:hypothetical protein